MRQDTWNQLRWNSNTGCMHFSNFISCHGETQLHRALVWWTHTALSRCSMQPHKETSDHGTPRPTNRKVHSLRHSKPLKGSAPSIPGSQTYLQVRDGTLRVQSQRWVTYLPCFVKYTLWCHNQGYGHLGCSRPLKSLRGSILVVDLRLF